MTTNNPDRRRMLQLSLAAIPALMTLGQASSTFAADAAKPVGGGAGPQHDFDFFLGAWHVKHRRLKQRLAGNNDWEEFEGSTDQGPRPIYADHTDGGKTWEINWVRYLRTA